MGIGFRTGFPPRHRDVTMRRPDFAETRSVLGPNDLKFLIDHFPLPGRDYSEIATVTRQLPSTIESLLESDYVLERILKRDQLLVDVSPFLLFNVLLRHSLPRKRTPLDRRVINYLANLLSLFVKIDRVHRVEPNDPVTYEYLVDMIARLRDADAEEQFSISAHIGNFSLFLTGMLPEWIDHRFRYKHRPTNRDYYESQGSSYYHQASRHRLADELELSDVFLRLALSFGHYSRGLNDMRDRFFSS